MAHEGARRVANRGGAHRALQHGGEEGAEELVRDGPQLLFALLHFLCRPGRWSTRLKLQRPPEGSAQVDGNVAKIDLAARGVDGLVHFNAPSWAVRAVMSSTTLPVCPKTGSTSPSLTVHLCLHTALLREIGNAPVAELMGKRELTVGVAPRQGFIVGDELANLVDTTSEPTRSDRVPVIPIAREVCLLWRPRRQDEAADGSSSSG